MIQLSTESVFDAIVQVLRDTDRPLFLTILDS